MKRMTKEQAKHNHLILKAFSEGKTIQYTCDDMTGWKDVEDKNYGFFDFENFTYRIKPESKIVPFTYEDDLVGKVIKSKHGNYIKLLITWQDDDCVGYNLDDGSMDYECLLLDYIFLDGSLCGKIVETAN